MLCSTRFRKGAGSNPASVTRPFAHCRSPGPPVLNLGVYARSSRAAGVHPLAAHRMPILCTILCTACLCQGLAQVNRHLPRFRRCRTRRLMGKRTFLPSLAGDLLALQVFS